MAFTIHHTQTPAQRPDMTRPFWYHLEFARDEAKASRRARQYALDNGGYVCVKDESGKTIFGTDPVELDRTIIAGMNRDFRLPSAQVA